jgi:type VI secretion system secreted protein Hcp
MAVDVYLKLDGIQGEATDEAFKDQIKVISYSWGGTQRSSVASGSGSGAGKVDLADLNIMKFYDKASPAMFKSLVAGTHVKSGVLSAVKAGSGNKPFLKLTLEELFVTAINVSASDEVPTESVSFSYRSVKVEYSTQNSQGVLTAVGSVTYDLGTNKLT